MTAASDICIEVNSDRPDVRRHAEELASRLGLTTTHAMRDDAALPPDEYRLVLDDEKLEWRRATDRPGRGLWVDFAPLLQRQSSRRGSRSKNQPLIKAIGKHTTFVIDATAGLGQDAALLASMGFTVLAIERSPIIFAVLEDGVRRALADPQLGALLGGRLHIMHADAREALRTGSWSHITTAAQNVPIVYIDPMFPPKRKHSALAKKNIRLVREIVGDDFDSADLLAVAREHADRVVVKRPTYADSLAPNPTISFTGKLARYDVYVQSHRT